MINYAQPSFTAPIPGESLTMELGSRPWQSPPQYATAEQALEYYLPRLESEEVIKPLLDVLEMGIPATTLANTMQLASVMEGIHSIDVGILILPVLVELLMLIGDTNKVKYVSGLENETKLRSSLVDLALNKVENVEVSDKKEDAKKDSVDVDADVKDKVSKGLMSRGGK